jgi:hypothetical protein
LAGERNTRRIRVSKSRTKGKNERIAFAATENAKVWTSVRKTYFKVEDKRLARELEPLTETLETVATAETGVEGGGCSIQVYPILSKG